MSVNFKDEAEVRQYLDTIGIEYRFGCYSEKKPEVCHLLGDYLESIHKDHEKARKVYQSTCDDYGYAKSCLKYAKYTFIGRGKSGSKSNPTEGLSYFEKGCKLGDAESCLNAGLLYVSPKLLDKRDFSKGIEYLTRSCDMNNGDACFYLSGMHISGAEGPIAPKESKTEQTISSTNAVKPKSNAKSSDYIIEKNMEKAFGFTYKACELKNMYACANLSQMYARGEGTEMNPDKAEKFRKKAVELEEEMKNSKQILFQQT